MLGHQIQHCNFKCIILNSHSNLFSLYFWLYGVSSVLQLVIHKKLVFYGFKSYFEAPNLQCSLIQLFVSTVLMTVYCLHQLQFEISDILTVDYEEESFDVIYSRDSILHIPDKQKLFQKLYVSSFSPSTELLVLFANNQL